MGDRDLPDEPRPDLPAADAAQGAAAEDTAHSLTEIGWRVLFGTGAVVGTSLTGWDCYEFAHSPSTGFGVLLGIAGTGVAISALLINWHRLVRASAKVKARLAQRRRAGARDATHTMPLNQARTTRMDKSVWTARLRAVGAGTIAGPVLGALFGAGYGIGDAFALGTGWGLLSTAVAVAALAAAARWHGWLPMRPRELHTWRLLTAASVVLISVLSGAGLELRGRPAACPVPTELRVLTSAEDFAAVQAAIPDFEQYAAQRTGCYAIDVTAYQAPETQDIRSSFIKWQAQVRGGSGPIPESAGPAPDVWIPDSADQVPPGNRTFTDLGTVGKSPLVVAVPDAQASSGLNQSLSLPSLYSAITGRGLALAVPDPGSSEAGLTGLADLYQPPVTPGDEQQIERSGIFPADSPALLCAADQVAGTGGPAKTAYLASESAVASYDFEGGGCPQAAGQLAPLYPQPDAVLTFPFIAVNWPHGQSQGARAAAHEFYRWLARPGNDQLEQGGIRPLNCKNGGIVTPGPFDEGQFSCGSPAAPPTRSRVQQALAAFKAARPPAHVLIAVDDSAPMSHYLPQITAAIDTALPGTRFGSQDRFAIWKLPGDGGKVMSQLAGLKLGTPVNLQSVSSIVSDSTLTGHGHSSDYDVLASAAAMLYANGGGRPPPSNRVVLLTDGDGGSRSQNARSIEKKFRASPGVKLFIIAFGPSGCFQPMPALAAATGGRCYAASQSDPEHLLGQVLDQILG